MHSPKKTSKTPVPSMPGNAPLQAKMPPAFQLQANPLQLNKEPRTIKQCPRLDTMSDADLQTEIDLLQKWIEKHPNDAHIHYYIMAVTRYRDEIRTRTGVKNDPEEVTEKDYLKLRKTKNKTKAIKALTSPTGHQAGKGGWLESNTDNQALFDAFFSSALPSGITVDDLKISSSDFTKHNPGYKELPPPDLWPEMKKSLNLIKKIEGISGLTFKVASAYRSYRVNALAGGSKNSSHMRFLGLDLLPQGDKTKNEAFLKYYWFTAGKSENMGLGFYNTGRQHIDASKYRRWASPWKKEGKSTWKKKCEKHWGKAMVKKLDAL